MTPWFPCLAHLFPMERTLLSDANLFSVLERLILNARMLDLVACAPARVFDPVGANVVRDVHDWEVFARDVAALAVCIQRSLSHVS